MPERFLGQTLGGRYRLTRLIGSGAYAWVYEAVDIELEIAVAVKVLRPEHTGNETVETRFRREATTAARLRHPNIITVRDVGRADGVTWVAMDLVPHTLTRRLQILPFLPETDVVRLGLDIACALAAAHSEDVIHRDIKPDNILIGASGEAIVCDFGLARALTAGADLSATNQVLGTPHYFSPEQARGEPLDGRSDLYALGVTLYRAATGRLPFEGDDWYAVARQHVDVAPQPPRKLVPGISGAFEAVILRLLSKKPEERYVSASALVDALAMLPTAPVTGSRLSLTPGGTTTTHTIGRRKSNRRRSLLLGAAVASLLFLGVWIVSDVSAAKHAWGRFTGNAVAADSLSDSLAIADSLLSATDSLSDSLDVQSDSSVLPPDAGTTAPVPVTRPARLSVVSDADSTVISLNGRRVDFAPWRDDKLKPGRYIVDASLIGGAGVPGCPHSERTDTIVLSAGEQYTHSVSLHRCSRVSLDVTPRDATVSLLEMSGEVIVQGSADRISPVLVRAGEWRFRASARACAEFNGVDTLRAGADTVRIVLVC